MSSLNLCRPLGLYLFCTSTKKTCSFQEAVIFCRKIYTKLFIITTRQKGNTYKNLICPKIQAISPKIQTIIRKVP